MASKEYAGVTAWTFNGTEAHAIIGKRLIFCSRAEGLKTILDLRSSSDGKGLAASPAFQAAQKAASPQAAATVFVNLKPLLGIPNVGGLLEKARTNPLAALTFAGVAESVRNSNWLSLDIERRREDSDGAGLDGWQDHRDDECRRLCPAAQGE